MVTAKEDMHFRLYSQECIDLNLHAKDFAYVAIEGQGLRQPIKINDLRDTVTIWILLHMPVFIPTQGWMHSQQLSFRHINTALGTEVHV